jgi:hypothetical protein
MAGGARREKKCNPRKIKGKKEKKSLMLSHPALQLKVGAV